MENINVTVEQNTEKKPSVSANSSLLLRLVAYIIDAIIIGIPVGIVILILSIVTDNGFIGNILGPIVLIIYTALTESSSWQGTVGKKLLGLKVVNSGGQKLSSQEALVRNSVKFLLSSITFGLIFLVPLFRSDQAAVHDLVAKTKVLKK
jgi:uncharacterized RDD family membrane protein YckC